ncbi:stalk domain-containing protein [Paenibacillus sp. FSL R5-0912]|uniref:stalk domain-containing protein n=1 Tax=Paenibacillus sp. FSL R5-0912 TaxID=1536771 RepID=UPI001E5580D9|nr:stalk domain-containing protein [Paenibacillus sp. FSL R5-0912]
MKIPAAALLTVALIGSAPLTASAPISASAATSIATAKASNSIKVQNVDVTMLFDGVALQPPAGQYVFMYNNTTYVPLRFMSYALQKSVSWDAKNLKVTVADPSSSELVIIKEYLMNASNDAAFTAKNLSLTNVNASYVFNGGTKALTKGQSSYILNGSLYVPLRFLSESVGNSISWNQKTKTIAANTKDYEEKVTNGNSNSNGSNPSASATPTNTDATGAGGTGSGSAGTGTGKVSYESITSETEAKLNALQSQSQSTLMGIAFEYLSATDDAAKQSIKAKGKQQLASFTASFNNIIADAEQKLNNNGYSTDIIQQYKDAFEATLKAGEAAAEAMAN